MHRLATTTAAVRTDDAQGADKGAGWLVLVRRWFAIEALSFISSFSPFLLTLTISRLSLGKKAGEAYLGSHYSNHVGDLGSRGWRSQIYLYGRMSAGIMHRSATALRSRLAAGQRG